MHEFAAIRALVHDACAQLSTGERVARLTIVVGEASGHDEEHLRAHFDEACRGTLAEGATLEFLIEKLTARCSHCGAQFMPESLLLACSQCLGTELIITGGDGIRVTAIEQA